MKNAIVPIHQQTDRLSWVNEFSSKNKMVKLGLASEHQYKEQFFQYRADWEKRNLIDEFEDIEQAKVWSKKNMPLCIDVELASLCDLACPFCFRQSLVTADSIMEKKLYTLLLEQIVKMQVPSIKFNWRGEPLLNPNLPQYIAEAKSAGIVDTIINTNAVSLTKAKSRSLIDAGLDWIIISIDEGFAEGYEAARPGRFKKNNYHSIVENVQTLFRERERAGAKFPYIQVQSIISNPYDKNYASVINDLGKFVENISIKAFTKRGNGSQFDYQFSNKEANNEIWVDAESRTFIPIKRKACGQIFQRMMVSYSGLVSMCCYDWSQEHAIGTIKDDALVKSKLDQEQVKSKIDSGHKGFHEFMKEAKLPKIDLDSTSISTLEQLWLSNKMIENRYLHSRRSLDCTKPCDKCQFKESYEWEEVNAKT